MGFYLLLSNRFMIRDHLLQTRVYDIHPVVFWCSQLIGLLVGGEGR